MKINTKATNIELTPAISEYVNKKVEMLEKFLVKIGEVLVNVEVGKTTRHHKQGDVFRAEIQLIAGGSDYYVVAEMDDLYAAIDKAKDAMARELTSRRKKAIRLVRKGAQKLKIFLKGFKRGE